MERVSAVLVVLQPDGFNAALSNLDLEHVMLKAIVTYRKYGGICTLALQNLIVYNIPLKMSQFQG